MSTLPKWYTFGATISVNSYEQGSFYNLGIFSGEANLITARIYSLIIKKCSHSFVTDLLFFRSIRIFLRGITGNQKCNGWIWWDKTTIQHTESLGSRAG